MRNVLIVLLSTVFLSACGPTYRDTLKAKLDDNSPQQKRVILAQECRQEIEAGLKPDNPENVRHFERMRKICEEMTGQKISLSVTGEKE